MRINIVVKSADMNWIAGRFAKELCSRLPAYGIEAVINDPRADLEYQQIVYGEPVSRPAIGLFTHGKDRPMRFGRSYDGQISMNSVMDSYLKEAGCRESAIIEQPVDEVFIKKPIIFGVAGRTYSDGRKGEHLVAQMIEAGYTVVAWGSGWPCPILSHRVEELPNFYRSIDYYIDTSSDEGGCTPALECLAMGIPVISHSLGVDRPVLSYETHNWESLNRILYKLTHPRTYDDWARNHARYFKHVMERAA